jgi:hypothetical protein
MASIRRRVRKDGSPAHQVRWLEGGARDGDPQSEVFDSEPEAIQFKALVDAHGQHCPPGWVKGEGFVQPKLAEEDTAVVTFDVWAERVIDNLTGVEVRTRHDYRRDIRKHFVPTFGSKDICDAEAITPTDVRRWVNALEAGERDKKDKEAWARKPVSPKTLANLHGLLYAVFQAAVEAQPPLRVRPHPAPPHGRRDRGRDGLPGARGVRPRPSRHGGHLAWRPEPERSEAPDHHVVRGFVSRSTGLSTPSPGRDQTGQWHHRGRRVGACGPSAGAERTRQILRMPAKSPSPNRTWRPIFRWGNREMFRRSHQSEGCRRISAASAYVLRTGGSAIRSTPGPTPCGCRR